MRWSNYWTLPRGHCQHGHKPKTDEWRLGIRQYWLIIGISEENEAEKQEE